MTADWVMATKRKIKTARARVFTAKVGLSSDGGRAEKYRCYSRYYDVKSLYKQEEEYLWTSDSSSSPWLSKAVCRVPY